MVAWSNKTQVNIHVWLKLGRHAQQEEFINACSSQANLQSLFLSTKSNHQNKQQFDFIRPTAVGPSILTQFNNLQT